MNITGADIVIFYELDWNPQNDIQAMDRAHRIGQTKVVQVFKLVTKDSIETDLVETQKHKLNMASRTVRTQEGPTPHTRILDMLADAQQEKELDVMFQEYEEEGDAQ